MKRGKIGLLIFIMLIPLASANIYIEPLENDIYNIGDRIALNGYILEENDVDGFARTKLVCENIEYPLKAVPLSLEAQSQLFFPEDLQIPEISIPSNMVGNCWMEIKVVEGSKEIDKGLSTKFSVVKDLKGNFEVENRIIQLGKDLVIMGEVYKLDDSPVEGTAELYLNHNNTRYFIEVEEITDGKFSVVHENIAMPAGEYVIEIKARDSYGNEMLFEDIADIEISDELFITLNVDKVVVEPGESIRIKGNVENARNEWLAAGTVKISLGDVEYTTLASNGRFDFMLKVPEDIARGIHTINLEVSDKIGNEGREKVEIEVEAIASSIENKLNSDNYYPNDIVRLKPMLYDQAGDNIREKVIIDIYNPKDYLVLTKTVYSNEEFSFSVPQFASPGFWKIISRVGELSDRIDFNIIGLQKIDANIEQNLIMISNEGNINFEEDIEIKIASNMEKFRIKSKKDLMPNESMAIDLREEVPSGEYTVTIIVPGQEEELFRNVLVEGGKPVKSFNGLYIFIALLFLVFAFYLTFIKPKKPKKKKKHVVKKKKLANVRKSIDKQKSNEEQKKRDIKDFRESILKEIRKTEDKVADAASSKKSEAYNKKDEEGGFANMFG